ncbi:MAG TPA: SRPBCC domain-containing protein [Rhizomicrobium sp.]|nr:SRPBCC domain-containing protein [Rhizomicrobium sp.]
MKIALGIAVFGIFAAQAATAADIKDESYRDAEGHRVLREVILIDAPVSQVWDAFTTDKGFMKWAAPFAHITPGNGGMMESGFAANGKIGDPNNVLNRIDVYLPDSMIVMRNEHVPAGGPMDPDLIQKVRTIITFAPAGDGKTELTQTVVGFGETPGYDAMYAHFRDGNAEYLQSLAESFAAKSG